MHELDRAFKTFVGLQPNCVLALLFGKDRQVVLKEIADPQINLPELRGDKALVVEENGEERILLLEAMTHPEPDKLFTLALKALGMQYLQQRKSVVVVISLEQRFGPLAPENLLRLQLSNNEQLDHLGAIVLRLNSVEELQAWLNNSAATHGVN